MSNPYIRLGKIHLLAWTIMIPIFALSIRGVEDAFSMSMCSAATLSFGYVAIVKEPRAIVTWLTKRGLELKLQQLVFLASALIYLGVTTSFLLDADAMWLVLIMLIPAAFCWLAAVSMALLAKTPSSESL